MRDFPRETLNITKSPCSNEGTHRSDFVTLRYIQRFPGNNQRDESIDAQERAIRKYAEENDIEIVEEYIDRSRTGTNTDREEFQRMLNDSRYGLFDLVIVHKLDRFARNRLTAPSAGRYSGTTAWSCIPSSRNSIIRLRA